jgi:hypothetical protein
MTTLRPISEIGVHFSIGRKTDEIVHQQTFHESRIWCEWTDGVRFCCECWKHRSAEGISVRDALDEAGKSGWVVLDKYIICPCHQEDKIDPECGDIVRMLKYLESNKDGN